MPNFMTDFFLFGSGLAKKLGKSVFFFWKVLFWTKICPIFAYKSKTNYYGCQDD